MKELLAALQNTYDPRGERYCQCCHNRHENCACPKQKPPEGDEWAIKDGKGNPIRDPWAKREACKRIKKSDEVRDGDMSWCISVSVDKSVVDSLGGEHSARFAAWKERVMQNAIQRWHPVPRWMIGKRVGEIQRGMVEYVIGRPRADWVFIGDK